jgi:hypothetical protein
VETANAITAAVEATSAHPSQSTVVAVVALVSAPGVMAQAAVDF